MTEVRCRPALVGLARQSTSMKEEETTTTRQRVQNNLSRL